MRKVSPLFEVSYTYSYAVLEELILWSEIKGEMENRKTSRYRILSAISYENVCRVKEFCIL